MDKRSYFGQPFLNGVFHTGVNIDNQRIVEPANIETKDFKKMAFYCLALFPKRNIVSMSFELLQFCELEICVKIKLQGLQR